MERSKDSSKIIRLVFQRGWGKEGKKAVEGSPTQEPFYPPYSLEINALPDSDTYQ